jgi:beta-galactosidase/beta-glucuronidase
LVGTHRGGYDGFTFDITDALKPGKRQEVVVAVWDPTDAGSQPRGKQIRKPEGIWYTPTTGIWQTVWLEPVPTTSLADVKIVPDVDSSTVRITATAAGDSEGCWLVAAVGTRRAGAEFSNGSATVTLAVPNPQLWSPDSPHLYDLGLRLTRDGKTLDRVKSYFGMRKIALGQDEGGVTRLFLNNKPLFMMGLLDQGYWPDGLYTAPTDAALRYDLEVTKEFGFNMVRKHAKIEPDRWYYWCDRLGLVVWQDMPSGGSEHLGPHAEEDTERTPESAAQFEAELKAMIDGRGNHPSVVMWVPFNEGWGQFDTARIAAWTEKYDPTRLVNSVSGWTDREVGDVHDIHVYPGPAVPPLTARRAAVLGEYGGLGLKVSGELWQEKDNWSYRGYATSKKLSVAYGKLQKDLLSLIGDRGLAAAVYTQTTDVEVEINGLLTYDRSVIKIDPQVVIETNQKLLASSRDPVLPRPVVTPPARRRRSVRVPQPLAEESLPQGDAVPEPALLASAFE